MNFSMNEQYKIAALGGAVGAAAIVAVGVGASALGLFPAATDARLHDYLMRHPSIVYDMVAQAEADENAKTVAVRQKAIEKLGLKAFFDPAVAYVTGPATAKNTFVEFFDYNCVHCRNSFAAVKRFYEAHKKDTRFAFIELPINGPESTLAASAAIAARAQADTYLALHFALMGEKVAIDGSVLFDDARKVGLDTAALAKATSTPAVQKMIAAGRKLAQETSVSGTPSFIINGQPFDGEITDADFKRLVK
jgi:protein-disulfide isomerase